MRRIVDSIAGTARRAWRWADFRRSCRAIAPLDLIVKVPLADIGYRIEDKPFLARRGPGTIRSSFPDLETFSTFIRRDKKFQSVVDHFTRGVPWMETELFAVQYAQRLRHEPIRGFRTLRDLEDFYRTRYDALHAQIERHGIDPRLYGRGITPLYVHIAEHGEFIWPSDGNHRLAICSALGFAALPCRVHSRHRAWQEQRERVLADLEAGRPVDARLRAHPDMADLVEPSSWRTLALPEPWRPEARSAAA